MEFPAIEGYTLKSVIGIGSSGAVYLAERSGGEICAVKVLHSLSINREVLDYSFRKIGDVRRPESILNVYEYDVVQAPLFISMPFLGELVEGRRPIPHSLESVCGKISEADAWGLLAKIASGLAFLHREGVIHCNIKPSNIFYIVEGGEVDVRIGDVSLGWLGGVHRMDLDKLLIHLAPEQIESPGEIFEGAGLRWDVYGFGVLAYQLITGRPPRCAGYVEEARQEQDPNGVGLPFVLDTQHFMGKLVDQEVIQWPGKASSPGDVRRRAVIERCLKIDSKERWVDLRDIEREFIAIDQSLVRARIEAKAKNEKARQRKKLLRARVILLAAVVGFTAVAIFGSRKAGQLSDIRSESNLSDAALLKKIAERDGRLGDMKEKLEASQSHHAEALTNYKESRQQADALLFALLEPRNEKLDILDEDKLAGALVFYQGRLEDRPVADLSVRGVHDLFNVAFLKQKTKDVQGALLAYRSVQQATEALRKKPVPKEARVGCLQRAARAGLEEHDLLITQGESGEAMKALRRSEVFLGQLKSEGIRDPESAYQEASVSLRLGQRLRELGRYEEAAKTQMHVSRILEETQAAPGEQSQRFAFVMGQSTHELGVARRLQGQVTAAVDLQLSLVEKILALVEKGAATFEDRRLLAFAYTELGEMVTAMAGPQEGLEAHGQAVMLLKSLLTEQSTDEAARYHLARNYGELAAYDRDAGLKDDGLRKQQIAAGIMETLIQETPAGRRSSQLFRLEYADQKTSLAEFLGDAKKYDAAVASGLAALEILEAIMIERPADQKMEEVRTGVGLIMARVLGILGQNHERLGDKAVAKDYFSRSINVWKALSAAGEESRIPAEEIERGLSWSENRLEKLRK